jgi:hypothetical protein
MPVYHFNLNNADTIFDAEGTDLPDDSAARKHAVTVARELTFHNRAMFDKDWSRYTMSVIDDAGNEILSLALNDLENS